MQLGTGMDFFDTVVRYETHLWNHVDHHLEKAGAVALPTLFALRVVRRNAGHCRVQELRTELGVTVGAASKLVDRFERDGLAVRTPHPTDRRSSLISLTAAGEAALDAGVAVTERVLGDHLDEAVDITRTTAVLDGLLADLGTTGKEMAR
jgi:DNA-binding MarR family transcriptional regulator